MKTTPEIKNLKAQAEQLTEIKALQRRRGSDLLDYNRRIRSEIVEVSFGWRHADDPSVSIDDLIGAFRESRYQPKGTVNKLAAERRHVIEEMDALADQRKALEEALEETIFSVGTQRDNALRAEYDARTTEIARVVRPYCESDDEASRLSICFLRMQKLHMRIGEWRGSPELEGQVTRLLEELARPL